MLLNAWDPEVVVGSPGRDASGVLDDIPGVGPVLARRVDEALTQRRSEQPNGSVVKLVEVAEGLESPAEEVTEMLRQPSPVHPEPLEVLVMIVAEANADVVDGSAVETTEQVLPLQIEKSVAELPLEELWPFPV